MHLRRWLTSIVAVPLLVYVVLSGPRWIFYGLLVVASSIGLLEFIRMTAPRFPTPVKLLALLLHVLFFYLLWRGPFFQLFAVLCLWVMVPLVYVLFSPPEVRDSASEGVGKLALGFLYVSLPLALLLLIDRHPRGNVWILFLLTVIFLGDTGAFYFGRIFGTRKLYVSVSPGKTWAGAIGGLLVSVLSGLLFSRLFLLGGFPLETGFLAGILGVSGQVGDLVESMIKRGAGVKDSGRILPGHGGMLDRVDGLLFAIPVLYVFLAWSAP